jgi:hypothetical protein
VRARHVGRRRTLHGRDTLALLQLRVGAVRQRPEGAGATDPPEGDAPDAVGGDGWEAAQADVGHGPPMRATAAQVDYYESLCAEHRVRVELGALIRDEARRARVPEQTAEDRIVARFERARTTYWWTRAALTATGRMKRRTVQR